MYLVSVEARSDPIPLELELQITVSCYVGSWERTWVLYEAAMALDC